MFPIDTVWVDVTKHLLSGEQPVVILDRSRAHEQPKAWAGGTEVACTGEYVVPKGSLLAADPEWMTTRLGKHVMVPVHAYQTKDPGIASLFGLAMELGLRAAATLPDKPLGATMVLGHECHTMPDGTYRGYVGFSFRVK